MIGLMVLIVIPMALGVFIITILKSVDLGIKIEKCGGWPTYKRVLENVVKEEYREKFTKFDYLEFMLSSIYI